MSEIAIDCGDGACRSFVYRPSGGVGPWPAVLVFMDGIGIRPAILAVGERLATHGYVVLLPDLFYRSGPYEPMNARTVFADPGQRKVLMEKFLARATPANVMSDTAAFLDWLAEAARCAARVPSAPPAYCMGGFMSLTAARDLSGSHCRHGVLSPQPARDRCAWTAPTSWLQRR